MTDNINHPKHYEPHTGVSFECIELTSKYGFLAGNVIKYVWRHQRKNGAEDLRKARWYTEAIIADGHREHLRPLPTCASEEARNMLDQLLAATIDTREYLVWCAILAEDPLLLRHVLDGMIRDLEDKE